MYYDDSANWRVCYCVRLLKDVEKDSSNLLNMEYFTASLCSRTLIYRTLASAPDFHLHLNLL